ncbi:MAG: zinc-ribbon domain-containing protein [Ruminococcaceae bacterium]|nr:zinc-ribbon domain-containing protein [Oscillospiraceae bacterium]
MKCYHCNAELTPGAKFCYHCGKKVATFCSECGAELENGASFCTSCGTKIQVIKPKEEEKKTDILPDVGELAIETTKTFLEQLEENNHSTHRDDIRNAHPAQGETPARSEAPAKPQSSTHTDGSGGGAGQKIRRSSASVREAAAQRSETTHSQVAPAPAEATHNREVFTEQAPVHTPASTATSAQSPAYTPAAPAQQAPTAASTAAPAPVQTAAAQQAAAAPAPMQAPPVQTSVQPQAPVPSPVSQAAPTAPHIPAAPVSSAASAASVASGVAHTAGSAAAGLASEVAHTAGAVAVAGAKKATSTAKTIAIWAAVVVFVIGAVTACLSFFVSAPEDTVEKLITSVEELKYDDMLSCFDSTTEKQIRAVMGITGDLMGSLTGISMDLEDMMALAPSLAPYMEIPDLGIASAETVLYADCSKHKLMQYCETANAGGSIPTGYLSDNEIISFLMENNISLPGLENLIAQVAVVKITLKTGEVGYLPLINEGWGDWRIPMMDLMNAEGMG